MRLHTIKVQIQLSHLFHEYIDIEFMLIKIILARFDGVPDMVVPHDSSLNKNQLEQIWQTYYN